MSAREDQILAQARGAFLEEAQDLLLQLEDALLAMSEGAPAESLNAAFRAAHTIKGSASLFGLEAVVSFSHQVEALLDRLRSGAAAPDGAVTGLLLQCRDHIAQLLAAVDNPTRTAVLQAEGARLAEQLRACDGAAAADDATAPRPGVDGMAAGPVADAPADAAAVVASNSPCDWLLHARFGRDTFRAGFDPLSFLRYLPTVGEVVAGEAMVDEIPPLDELDPESCHLGTVQRLVTAAEKRQIEAVFDFVIDNLQLDLVPSPRREAEMGALLAHEQDAGVRLGEILVRIGALTERELQRVLDGRREDVGTTAQAQPPIGHQIVAQQLAPQAVVEAAARHQGQLRARQAEESRFVRVRADKLDALITMIGELVIAGSATQILAGRGGDPALAASAARVATLLEGTRDRALQLRMVPIGETFARFRRIVHEVSRTLGKEVDLVVTGGEAELDKSMVDQIVDPLTHLVRNALDHGLEAPAERLACGKPARAVMSLHAVHESGSIVIEVSDDGRGLSRDRILAKAVERGLVAPGTELSDAQVQDLVFQPGFSTAPAVTDLSGRGVGLDVVRRNIEGLRGEVSMASTPGAGTRIRIRLPLTLAIIDGFRFDLAERAFVVPLDAVVECIETPGAAAVRGDGCFHLRGEVLPLLCLRSLFGLDGDPPPLRSVLVMRCGQRKVGVLVDRLLGEHQTVIKPLGRLFRCLRGISGSTILGTGSVALILDLPTLLAMADEPTAGHRPTTPPPHPAAVPIPKE